MEATLAVPADDQRYPTEPMRHIAALLIALVTPAAFAGGLPGHTVIHLLDPRVVTFTSDTMPIEWGNAKTDVIGMRTLNATEAAKLHKLLRDELADDDNTPFCGHSPAYAVTVTQEGKPPTTVTLCGTCGTWAKRGELRALHGKAALEYLDKLLPLPDVFRPVDGKPAKPLVPFDDTPKRPFAELRQ
tara:strand:- start:519 stop:1079 length:561 start_codon:yes stop_codon:yes gene_type:complete